MPKKKAKTTSTPSNSESQKPKRIWPTWVKALIGFGTILVLSVGIYLLSPATQIQALSCTGNYYYTPQQVYAIAGVSIDDRTFLHTPSQVASALKQNPLIESATVELDGQNMSIEITEKTIIGYFEQDGFQYLVSSEGERIRMTDELDASTLVHFPLIAKMEDGSMADIDLIAKEV
ncbi:MAG: FtsQ-type POTRA domain-containing protein, partial [Allobaculum sp.]|nr:FtsQ-type POTRA domain-containing protein [Allobaculum sp.]